MLDNQFTCPNGHTFNANAKIRARCPECGVTARRDFKVAVPKLDDPEPKDELKPKDEPKLDDSKPEPKKPVLLKQGRPRVMVAKRKPPVKTKTTVMPRKTVTTSAGLVKSTRIKSRGTMPTIKARPVKTAVARGIKDHGSPRSSKPFWHEVADKYGI